MPTTKCSHFLSSHKKVKRLRELMGYARTATVAELSTKLCEVWSDSQCIIAEVRILLTLGANPHSLFSDNYGEEVLNQRVRIGNLCPRCKEQFCDFLKYSLKIHKEQFEKIPIRVDSFLPGHVGHTVLALDGGGMRGLVSVVCLLFISRRLFGNEYLPHLFDWIVGTSTGSLLGLSLAKGLSLTDVFFLYWDMKDRIFLDGSTMKRLFGNIVDRQSINLDFVLNECFPDKFTFNRCPKRLTVPALDISTTPARLHIFRNYSPAASFDTDDESMDDVLFRDAARASSAAPTYFHPHKYKGKNLVDGSFVANCPLNILFQEFDQCNRYGSMTTLAAILSIGTGEPQRTTRKYNPGKGKDIRSKGRNLINLSTLLLEQVVGHEMSALESAEIRCSAQNIPFIRVSPKGIKVRIDQVNDEVLIDMIWTTLRYLSENTEEIDRLGRLFIDLFGEPSYRRVRSNTSL
ncbi:hypothetical protein AB6A40_004530 [Gnathostoma spinigerum]|uniref:PNPLA domain-containing protein n=1 Tax=Gnathostoma spinigerum TaxID=75299 RepID=A0ABD6EF22_9BILA